MSKNIISRNISKFPRQVIFLLYIWNYGKNVSLSELKWHINAQTLSVTEEALNYLCVSVDCDGSARVAAPARMDEATKDFYALPPSLVPNINNPTILLLVF